MGTRIEDFYLNTVLSQSQRNVISKLEEFLEDKSKSVFILKGYAGSGKTFLTLGLIKYLEANGYLAMLCAPTGKASKVLTDKSKKFAQTVHGTIYGKPETTLDFQKDVAENGFLRLHFPLRKNLFGERTVFIVDEASLVGDNDSSGEYTVFGSGRLLKDFFCYVNLNPTENEKKIIFIGDSAQLPPVGMNLSPALDKKYLQKEFGVLADEEILTDIVRQVADSKIISNSLILRKGLETSNFNDLHFQLKEGEVQEATAAEGLKVAISTYKQDIKLKTNLDFQCTVIVGSNRLVSQYNKCIRQEIFENADNIQPGDLLLVCKNSMLTNLLNGDFIRVLNVGISWNRTVTLNKKNERTGVVEKEVVVLKFRKLKVFSSPDLIRDLVVLENLIESEQGSLSQIENQALFVNFCIRHPDIRPKSERFNFELTRDEEFNALHVKYGYAMTCHKAQGSQWPLVIVDCYNDNKRNAAYFRWLYTAITRASQKLILISPPHFNSYSNMKFVMGNLFPGALNRKVNTPYVKEDAPASCKNQSNLENFSSDNEFCKAEEFGLTKSTPFLLEVFRRVCQKLTPGISIKNVRHCQYCEIYVFETEGNKIQIELFYNGKNTVTKVKAKGSSLEEIKILRLLEVVIGFSLEGSAASTTGKPFSKDFLVDFDKKIQEEARNMGLKIKGRREMQYSLRYIFYVDNDSTTIDYYFNSKNLFTKVNIVNSGRGEVLPLAKKLTEIIKCSIS